MQIDNHFSLKAKAEMSIEKLQKIATAPVEPKYKARWLKWWNSSDGARKAYKFPRGEVYENVLDNWLQRAVFWAQVLLSTYYNYPLTSPLHIHNIFLAVPHRSKRLW